MKHVTAKRIAIGLILAIAAICLVTCNPLHCGGKADPVVITGEKTVHPEPVREEVPVVSIAGGDIPQHANVLPLPVLTPGVRDTLKVYLPGRTDTVYVPADTAAIVADFLKRRTYEQTLPIDTAGVKGAVTARGQVQFNRLDSLQLSYQLTLPPPTRSTPKPWGIGVQVGATLINGRVKPYGGIGLSYNPIRF